jgi:hypothetical protein
MILVLQMTTEFRWFVKYVDAEDYIGVYLWCMNICLSVLLHASKNEFCVCNVNTLKDLTFFCVPTFWNILLYVWKVIHFIKTTHLWAFLYLFIVRRSRHSLFLYPVFVIKFLRSHKFDKNTTLLPIACTTFLKNVIFSRCPLLSSLPLTYT